MKFPGMRLELTDAEIAERVRRCPQLARVLFVHPETKKAVIHTAQTVAGLDWHGVNIIENPLLPTSCMVWADREGNVLAVQMPEND